MGAHSGYYFMAQGTSGTFLEFFAGSGLAAEGLRGLFSPAWANDICPKKAKVYRANHDPTVFHLASIEEVNGRALPAADLAWASFPCQDLSLAGKMEGLNAKRSGLVWQWLRVLDEIRSKPTVLVAENVLGLVSAENGKHYRALHRALEERGYACGAVLLDAIRWVPQSRPRVFVIATRQKRIPKELVSLCPGWGHPRAIRKAAEDLEHFLWWNLPQPPRQTKTLDDVVDFDAPVDDEATTKHKLALIPRKHMVRLVQEMTNGFTVAPGYRRMREGVQCLELRFDKISGCLRTPEGGSSRQTLVLKRDGRLCTRLLTVREAARLMGAPKTFKLPGTYNDGYKAMGDAVVVPVVNYLGRNLLKPLADADKRAHV